MTRKEHGMIELDHQQLADDPNVYLSKQADQWIALFLGTDHEDFKRIKQLTDALHQFGVTEQESFWQLNKRMEYPLQKRLAESQGGGKVTQLLRALQVKVLQIKPPKSTFLSAFKIMFKLLFSWHQSAFQMWLENYPQHKQEVSEIVELLAQHKRQLNRDNSMLLADQKGLEEQLGKLENCFDLLCRLEDKLKETLTSGGQELIEKSLRPPLQQRIIELQQQLLIARQAVMTLELFIQDNEAQIKSIDQAVYTTTSVVDITAGIAMVQHGKGHLAELNQTNGQRKAHVDMMSLKQTRQVIDKALKQMDELRSQSQNSADKLNLKQVLAAQNQQHE